MIIDPTRRDSDMNVTHQGPHAIVAIVVHWGAVRSLHMTKGRCEQTYSSKTRVLSV